MSGKLEWWKRNYGEIMEVALSAAFVFAAIGGGTAAFAFAWAVLFRTQ